MVLNYGDTQLGVQIDLVSACQLVKCLNVMDLFTLIVDDQGNGTLKRSKKKSFNWYKKVIATKW